MNAWFYRRRKHLVTFPNVADGFDLEDPTFLRPCFKCGAPKQRSMLVYERQVNFNACNCTMICLFYSAFHKHANSEVQKLSSQLCFSLPSIIITITSNEPWNTETHKTDRNPPITNHKPWPFEPVKVKFCFLRGPLRWLTAAKNAIVSWLLNFRIRMFVKSAVSLSFLKIIV